MNLSSEVLSDNLERELGAGSVKSDFSSLAAYTVDGKTPAILCLPSTPEQVGSILRICSEAQAAVIPWGGGTSMKLGNVPRHADVVVGLEKLDKLIEHDDVNLTATAQAGMRVASFQRMVGERRQFLAIDPPHPPRATVGGIVAANVNGPRRMAYGGLRDLVIGMKVALATGEQIKAGGKVVKNVAGYDLCKLFVGSLGTLGIITEVTFRMAPLPESAATVVAWGPLAQSLQMVDELSRSPLLPAAITVLNADAAKATGNGSGMPVIAVWAEGFEENVTRHLHDLQAMAEVIGLTSEILRGETHRRLWEEIRDFGMNGQAVLYRLTVPLASVAEVVRTVEQWSTSEKRVRYITHAGTGTLWVSVDADPAGMGWFPRLTALAQSRRGHAVIAAAPAELKKGIDVWGQAPPSLNLMREIKRQFDPQGILNPGRFLARL
jgi:glycolate oxidase FAD binding subunit